jgi:hypothetical protein
VKDEPLSPPSNGLPQELHGSSMGEVLRWCNWCGRLDLEGTSITIAADKELLYSFSCSYGLAIDHLSGHDLLHLTQNPPFS